MSDNKKISKTIEQARNRKTNRPTYIIKMNERFVKWTGIEDEDSLDALDYLSGDLFFEMRKLTSILCDANEKTEKELVKKIRTDIQDKEKAEELVSEVRAEMSANKIIIKDRIDASWRDIVDKQKTGIDKLSIVIIRYKEFKNDK